jgi:PadR family transcriptional regulator PadR
MRPRLTVQTLEILTAFFKEPHAWSYGYELSRITNLKSGTIYPILKRLAKRSLLETSWESPQQGRPSRHLYRLTVEGEHVVRKQTPDIITVQKIDVQIIDPEVECPANPVPADVRDTGL